MRSRILGGSPVAAPATLPALERVVVEIPGPPPVSMSVFEADLSEERREFVRRGRAETVIVSLGAEGALLASRDGTERLSAPGVPVESRIGAGDSMVGGIVLALARGDSMREAALLGLAAGSATVMTPGTELCRPADVERLYAALHARPAPAPPAARAAGGLVE